MRSYLMRPLIKMVLAASLLIIAGCGFHLRGLNGSLNEIPPWLNHIAIVIESASNNLGHLLKEQLESYNRIVSPSQASATYWLVIEKDSLQKQITNVSASTTPRQYLLLYTVQFSLVEKNGASILTNNTITVSRQFTLNNERILGSDYEELTFKREMEREAASLIMSRIAAAHPIESAKKSRQKSIHRAH